MFNSLAISCAIAVVAYRYLVDRLSLGLHLVDCFTLGLHFKLSNAEVLISSLPLSTIGGIEV